MGMTLVLLVRAGTTQQKNTSYSLVEIVKALFVRAGEYLAHHSKRGLLHFLRIALVGIFRGYRIARTLVVRHYKTLVDYIDGKGMVKKQNAASLYLKNISVHKDEAKKNGKKYDID